MCIPCSSSRPLISGGNFLIDQRELKEIFNYENDQKVLMKIPQADGSVELIQETISSEAYRDLSRLGNLTINGKQILDSSKSLNLSEAEVSREIFIASSKKIELQRRLSIAVSQALTAYPLTIISQTYLSKNDQLKWAHNGIDRRIVVNTSAQQFKLIQEYLFELKSADGISEDKFYYKQKIVLSGNTQDLVDKKVDKIKAQCFYTSTTANLEVAKNANYYQLKAFPDNLSTEF